MSWKYFRGKELTKRVENEVSDALYRAAEATGAVSDQQVPHDEGTLQRSKFIKVDPQNPLNVVLSYGGGQGTGYPRVPYAVKWHENSANFQKGRKKNYLRDPIKNFAPQAVKKELQKVMKSL